MKQAKLTRAKPGDIAIYLFFILLAFITIYPFYYVVIMSPRERGGHLHPCAVYPALCV